MHDFCGIASMFLTAPTIEELKQIDLPDLVDMLSKQALEYSRLMKLEGVSSKSIAIREMIVNIQGAITAKRAFKKSTISR